MATKLWSQRIGNSRNRATNILGHHLAEKTDTIGCPLQD